MQQRKITSIKRFGLLSCAMKAIGVLAFGATSAPAETLNQALVSAYMYNPTLEAQRAQLRATDEEAPQALSGFRPTLKVEGEASITYGDNLLTLADELRTWEYALTLDQPIFKGFRTINSVRQAEANIRAGREDLRAAEQTVLLNATTAYVDVLRDQAILRLQNRSVSVLFKELQAAKDKFEQGDNTRTEVEQARARHARALSQASLAQANLKASRATYEQIIGHAPLGVREPSIPSYILPKSLKSAIEIGVSENPSLAAQRHREESSRYGIDVVRGELLPEINLQVSYGETFYDAAGLSDKEEFKVVGRLTVPLYLGGNISARIRQAEQVNSTNFELVSDIKTRTQQGIIAAWSNLAAARAQLVSNMEAVKANKIALSGLRQEQIQGQRTLLDVLNAEQELLSSQVGVVQTKRNIVVASYGLLQAVGRLTAKNLKLPVMLYDPERNYNDVRNKLFGFRINTYEGEGK